MRPQAGAFGEGPPKKGETGLFALTVYAHGGLPAESLVPAVSLESSGFATGPSALCCAKGWQQFSHLGLPPPSAQPAALPLPTQLPALNVSLSCTVVRTKCFVTTRAVI